MAAKKKAVGRYGKKASSKVGKAMGERKRGSLRSGGSGKKVKSQKQAIAIGLSEARRAGGKVPPKKTKTKTGSKKTKSASKKSGPKRNTASKKRGSKKKSVSKKKSASKKRSK